LTGFAIPADVHGPIRDIAVPLRTSRDSSGAARSVVRTSIFLTGRVPG